MPADFAFSIHYGFVDDFSMFDSTFTLMGICNDRLMNNEEHDSTISLIITTADKQRIYDAIVANKFLLLPLEFKYDPHSFCVAPAPTDILEIRANGIKKTYTFYYECEPLDKPKAKRYQNVVKLIKEIIDNSKGVKAMPETCLGFL
jgi:hypothetical protein